MCCFTKAVKSVSATNIFARMAEHGRQYVVYSMNLDAAEPLAMVLPIPVAAGSGERAVRFINLEKYPDFFEDLAAGFPEPVAAGWAGTRSRSVSAASELAVVQVGSFEASFVPTVRDFTRLDERFRLPADAFDKLPGYQSYGFAVFKLKPGEHKIHPMAFEFPTALTSRLFFPTVHIHDGKVHARAKFDHALYCQSTETFRLKVSDWKESDKLADQFVEVKLAEGIVMPKEHCFKRKLQGTLKNEDTFVEAAK